METLIKTPRLNIREMALSDADDIRDYADDKEVMRYLMLWFDMDNNIEDFVSHGIRQAQRNPDERKEFFLTIQSLNEDKFIGTAIIAFDHDSSSSAEIGYIIKQSEWSKGYATETAQSLIRYCFEVLKLHRVFGKCDKLNSSSANVMEKCGMTYEGTLREHIWLRDHWRSSRLYGIIDREYFAKTAAGLLKSEAHSK
ncbi:MAG: GNAT family N-acetyltransferase [Spirochaetes bacterium]|nr:GNAT family N-acetyltransferase [Spirochaetota bacterium]